MHTQSCEMSQLHVWHLITDAHVSWKPFQTPSSCGYRRRPKAQLFVGTPEWRRRVCACEQNTQLFCAFRNTVFRTHLKAPLHCAKEITCFLTHCHRVKKLPFCVGDCCCESMKDSLLYINTHNRQLFFFLAHNKQFWSLEDIKDTNLLAWQLQPNVMKQLSVCWRSKRQTSVCEKLRLRFK